MTGGSKLRGLRQSGARSLCVLSSELSSYACAQLRLLSPIGRLSDHFDVHWLLQFDGREFRLNLAPLKAADIVVVQRHFPSAETTALLDHVYQLGIPVVYETDDLFGDWMHSEQNAPSVQVRGGAIANCIARANAVIVATPALARTLSAIRSDITVVPNFLDDVLWSASVTPRTASRTIIGYAGTPTHLDDLAMIEGALLRISHRYKDKVGFVFMGCVTDSLRSITNGVVLPFETSYARYAGRLPQLGLDIGLAPLRDTHFNQMKSDVKWLEYSLCGAAGIYSNVGQYVESVRHGLSGMLAGPDPNEWFEVLDYLVREPVARAAMANTARESVLNNRTLLSGIQRYRDVYLGIGH